MSVRSGFTSGLACLTWLWLSSAGLAVGAQNASKAGGRTVWDGVYTAEQADRGKALYTQSCAACHSADLRGDGTAPSLVEGDFAFQWADTSVGELYAADSKADAVDATQQPAAAELYRHRGLPSAVQSVSDRHNRAGRRAANAGTNSDYRQTLMNRHRVWSLALASVVFIQLFSSAQGDAGQGSTEDVDFATAIAKIAASAEHHFADIAGAKGAGEYKTSLRIKYRGTTFGGLIRPSPGGGWSCTYPVLITLDKTAADAAVTEWTSALSSVFGNGQPLSSIAESESRLQSHSNLERAGSDASLSVWGAERGHTSVRLFYTVDRDDLSYYIEVIFSENGAAR